MSDHFTTLRSKGSTSILPSKLLREVLVRNGLRSSKKIYFYSQIHYGTFRSYIFSSTWKCRNERVFGTESNIYDGAFCKNSWRLFNYFRKKLHSRYLTGLLLRLCKHVLKAFWRHRTRECFSVLTHLCHLSLSIPPKNIKRSLIFFCFFRGYRKRPAEWNGLIIGWIMRSLLELVRILENSWFTLQGS